MSTFCDLARSSLESWLSRHRLLTGFSPSGRRAGCFVSLHDERGELRGCIGTIEPEKFDLSDEIVSNAIAAGTRDPRFPPVTRTELDRLHLEVSVLGEPEPVNDRSQLDPRRYGLILASGSKRGLLLPDLEGVDTIDRQMDIVRRKARIGPDEPVKMWRFEVEKYDED